MSAQSASVIGTDESAVEIQIPGGAELPEVGEALPACANFTDDDDDGMVDLADPDCSGPLDEDESDDGSEGDPAPDGDEALDLETGVEPESAVKAPEPPKKIGKKGGKRKQKGSSGKGGKGGSGGTAPPIRKPDGSPTRSNPSLSVAPLGPAPIGVPNFMIDQFRIPPFLLPLYQACGTQYGIPWQVLASINRIETAFGTNLNVSSAGAVGWMQFLPSTWKGYGVDANRDGRKDPYNPVDAICAAARYLKASGGEQDLRRAIFAYNHADWYVDEVLLYARQYGKLPASLISSLTGLTEGAHFPVAAKARYADDISERRAAKRSRPRRGVSGNVADVIRSSPTRRGINIYARKRAPVVAVNDGVIERIGRNARLGDFVVLEDAFGNRFTYAQLGRVARAHPVPKRLELTERDLELVSTKRDAKPSGSATGGSRQAKPAGGSGASRGEPVNTEDVRERLYALPQRPRNAERADLTGQLDDPLDAERLGFKTFKSRFSSTLRFNRKTMKLRPLRVGSKVIGGTVLGRIGKARDGVASHLHFAIRPAGRGAKKIDPKPILDGWKLLESTAIYRAAGRNPFERRAGVGQILLMSKSQLERRALSDPRLELYSCGRRDIRTGQVDRRVLAALEFLTERGFRLTVTSLRCGHSFLTKSGNVSHHSSGNAVDIARVNGLSILGNQGRGSITEAVIQDLLQLQGSLQPAQIISLMRMGGPTFAMADHADHIHLGFTPPGGRGSKQLARILRPSQWERLIERIAEIDEPTVRAKPSEYSLPSGEARRQSARASAAHQGE